MTARYFRLSNNKRAFGYRVLGDVSNAQGQEFDDLLFFANGQPVRAEGQLRISVEQPGKALDFTQSSAGLTPIVHKKVADLLTQLAPDDLQFVPVMIDQQPEPYHVLVATRTVDCIDDRACAKVTYWKPEDGVEDMVGQRRNVEGLRIDPRKVDSARVFRCHDWPVALVISEDIKEALVSQGFTGMIFEDVTRPASP